MHPPRANALMLGLLSLLGAVLLACVCAVGCTINPQPLPPGPDPTPQEPGGGGGGSDKNGGDTTGAAGLSGEGGAEGGTDGGDAGKGDAT